MPGLTLTRHLFRKQLLGAIAAVLTVGVAAAADAQCAFPRPAKARKSS